MYTTIASQNIPMKQYYQQQHICNFNPKCGKNPLVTPLAEDYGGGIKSL